jgi:prephenate dehydrogenase
MSNSIEKVGFVGFGPMGQLMAKRMFEGDEIEFVDPGMPEVPEGITASKTERAIDFAIGMDTVVLAVPASAMPGVAKDVIISPRVKSFWPGRVTRDFETPLIVEPCSVKLFPEAVIEGIDPDYPELLHCHPMFGPESASESVANRTLFVTKKNGEKADRLLDRWQGLGVNIIEMTADEHDKLMFERHVKPFVLGRMATAFGIGDIDMPELDTTSFLAAKALADLDKKHSEELFRTIVSFNPYARDIWQHADQIIRSIRDRNILSDFLLSTMGIGSIEA